MKRLFFLFSVICSVAFCEEIQNGDFSKGLVGWGFDRNPNVQIDPNVKAGNLPAVRISGAGEIRQYMNLEENSRYELSCLVKGEGISNANPAKQGMRVVLHAGKRWERATGRSSGACRTGTFDWTKVTHIVDTAKFKTGKVRLQATLNTTGKVWFADFRIVKLPTSKKSAAAETKERWFREVYRKGYPVPYLFPTDRAFGFVKPGEAAEFRLITEKAENLQYRWVLKDETGKQILSSPLKKCSPEETIRIPGQKRGYYILDVSLFSGKEPLAFVQSAFAAVPPIAKRDPFFNVNHFGLIPTLKDGYKAIGAGSVSLPFTMNFGESPEFYAKNRFERYYKDFLNGDFKTSVAVLAGISQKGRGDADAVRKGYPLLTEKWLREMEKRLRAVASEVKGKISVYDVLMEVHSHANMKDIYAGTWTESMSELLFTARIASRVIREVDPNAKVAVGGCNNPQSLVPYERILMEDLSQDFDLFSIDGYAGNWNMVTGVPSAPENSMKSFYQEASSLAASLGKSKFVRNTETGYAICYGDRFDTGRSVKQAALTARLFVISKAAPVSQVSIFRLGTTYGGTFADNTETCMTTVWKPLKRGSQFMNVPLPGGAAYATAARELAFVRFKKEIVSGDRTVYADLFQRPDGKTLAVLWQIEDTGKLKLHLGKGGTMISMLGTETAIPAGKTVFSLSEAPIYFITEENAESLAQKINSAVQNMRPVFRAAGRVLPNGKVRVFCSNAAKENALFRIGEQSVKVFPGSIGTLDVSWEKGTDISVAAPDGTILKVRPKNDVIRAFPVASVPVFDGSGSWFRGNPGNLLKYPENIKPESALQPERGYFRNSFNPNGHNVSARWYLGYDRQNLYLAVDVDDPVHQQRRTGEFFWHDDSIQIAAAARTAPPAEVRLYNTPSSAYQTQCNYGLALANGKTGCVHYYPKAREAKLSAKVTRNGGHTLYEVALPWKEIKSSPDAELCFGFVVFDNNKPSQRVAPYWLESSPGIAGGRDDAKLPIVIFDKK